jgi:hypothetical protein
MSFVMLATKAQAHHIALCNFSFAQLQIESPQIDEFCDVGYQSPGSSHCPLQFLICPVADSRFANLQIFSDG